MVYILYRVVVVNKIVWGGYILIMCWQANFHARLPKTAVNFVKLVKVIVLPAYYDLVCIYYNITVLTSYISG